MKSSRRVTPGCMGPIISGNPLSLRWLVHRSSRTHGAPFHGWRPIHATHSKQVVRFDRVSTEPDFRKDNLRVRPYSSFRRSRLDSIRLSKTAHPFDKRLSFQLLKLYCYSASTSSPIASNCSNAVRKSSIISAAITSGSGKFAESSRLSSFSQKISRLILSRCINSS